MKASELRIGNLAIVRGEIIKIDIGHLGGMIANGLEVKPIPLTEEWIVKFGFGKIKAHDKFYWFALNINDENFQHPFFHYNPNDKFATLCSAESESTIIEIKYVHQLQNLYFALTGEELTIKTQ